MTDQPAGDTNPEHSTPTAGADALEREALLGFLASEIDNLRSEEQAPGWTKWALLAALAALSWLILNTIEHSGPTPHGTAVVFFVLTLLSQSLTVLCSLLEPERDAPLFSGKRYTFWSHYREVSTPALALGVVKFSLPLVLVHSLEDIGLQWYHRCMLTVVYGLLLLATSGIFLLSFLRVPVRRDMPYVKMTRIIALLFYGAVLWTAIASLHYMYSTHCLPAMADWRLGGLLYVLIFVLFRVATLQSNRHTIESLVGIRRSLALGHVGPDAAARQADIALLGMRLDDVMEQQVQEIVSLLMRAEEDAAKALSILEVCGTLVEQRAVGKEAIVTLIHSATEDLQRAQAHLETVKSKVEKFSKVIRRTVGKDAGSDAEAQALKQKVRNALRSLGSRHHSAVEKARDLLSRLDAYSPLDGSSGDTQLDSP